MFLRPQAARSQTLQAIPDGVAGVGVTLTWMTRLVREGKTEPEVRSTALSLTSHLDQKDFVGEVEALFDFVQNKIRYVHDVTDVETVSSPVVLLQDRTGDCDDKAVLLAALLESIGHKTRFVAGGFDRSSIEHVFVETLIGSRWVPLDATEPHPMGWRPAGIIPAIVRHN